MDKKIEKLGNLLLDLKSDIVVSYIIGAVMMENTNFIKIGSDPNPGQKYTIGKIGDMNIIINPYQRFNDYKVYNPNGELISDLSEHDILDLI